MQQELRDAGETAGEVYGMHSMSKHVVASVSPDQSTSLQSEACSSGYSTSRYSRAFKGSSF
jgi:hypothetical protein